MGNGTSRVVGCFVPFSGKSGVDLEYLEPLDEGLGHSFCYVRPPIFDSPAITPSNSERFTVDSSTLDSETLSGSFRQESLEDPSSFHRPAKYFPETTFKTISGASVSANVSTARTGNQIAMFAMDVQEPAASFESTSSFAAIPLQPVPRGSGPLNGFMSGPLERGFASGPLERGGGFMSGPMEKGVMSGPIDPTDKSNFSAPLSRGQKRHSLHRFMRSVRGPMRRTFSRHLMGSSWMQRFLFHPVTQFVWHSKESKFRSEPCRNSIEGQLSEGEYSNSRNLQWAHGKAGEDRVQVVLSEEQGWLFIGIYDGFSGPDAPDFLMTHLYKAIDRELEGLLWDYEDKSITDQSNSEVLKPKSITSERSIDNHPNCRSSEAISYSAQKSFGLVCEQLPVCELVEESDASKIHMKPICVDTDIFNPAPGSERSAELAGQGRKTVRLYELLKLEAFEGEQFMSTLPVDSQVNVSSGSEADPHNSKFSNSSSLICQLEEPTTSGHDEERPDQSATVADAVPGHVQSLKKSVFGSKIRAMYRKQKSLRKKLFPWSYDWHREEVCIGERIASVTRPIRRCRSGIVDHKAVLRAMAQALQSSEEGYMEMVENALDTNPELGLMGSCVLVMLMKDQDVYVLNLGDSRVILAQERQNDRHSHLNFLRDDLKHRNRSGESLVHMELDRISEESPMHNQSSQVSMVNKSRDISLCRLKMRAVQLSTDHSTSIEEEICRIKAEHPDDDKAIHKDRVKGQLKVTRAFGAGFLKKPTFNGALLEMFRIDYVGTGPYISCKPSLIHHRLSSSDRFLVLSSDGLYQYFSNEEVVAHVTWFMENVPEGDPAQYLIAELLFRAAKKNGMDFHELLDIPQGDRRKYHDDVSVVVVSLEGRIWRSSG